MVPDNQLAVKWERLDIHHVQFRSCGGKDTDDNLVPLCPNCHTSLHTARRSGDDYVTDQALLDTWNNWKSLAAIVPPALTFGAGPPVFRCRLNLDIYGIDVDLNIDEHESYAAFRSELLGCVVEPLRINDPHFPFLRGIDATRWSISSDDATATPWNQVSAVSQLSNAHLPLRFTCPAVVLLNRDPHWLASHSEPHRWM